MATPANKSEGQRFIAKHGGTLRPEHVYLDDAISRAEFKKRPGLIALLNAANDKQFDAVSRSEDRSQTLIDTLIYDKLTR